MAHIAMTLGVSVHEGWDEAGWKPAPQARISDQEASRREDFFMALRDGFCHRVHSAGYARSPTSEARFAAEDSIYREAAKARSL